jgi:hypothetical protein
MGAWWWRHGYGWSTSAEALQATAAVILVGVTAYYAKMTRDLAKSTRDMASAMAVSQERAEELRRRERSERAAISALDALRAQGLGIGAGYVDQGLARDVRHILMWESPFVSDVEVRNRMRACSNAAFVAGWSDEGIANEATDRGQISLRLQKIATTTRETLEAYLTERPLPEWIDLPDEPGAQAWVLQPLG